MTALLAVLLIGALISVSCDHQSSSSKGVRPSAYWGGKPPNPNVTLPLLPAALPVPAGSPDGQAKALAGLVEAGSPNAVPAIITALRLSGISIRDASGLVTVPGATPGDGIGLDQWQVLVLGKFAENGSAVRLSDLSGAITSQIKVLSGQPLGDWILAGLRAHYSDQQPQRRFLTRFIVELIRQSPWAPADVLGNVAPADVMLDGVASQLVLLRVVADIAGFLHQAQSPTASSQTVTTFAMRSGSVGDIGMPLADAKPPCAMSEDMSKYFDGQSTVLTTFFDKFTEWMTVTEKLSLTEGQIAGTQFLKDFTTVANMLFALVKVFSYYSALSVKIDMKTPPPLKRTPNRTPGELKILTVSAKMDPSNSQLLNCVRVALNLVGMDVSVQNDGVISGSQVNWVIAKGGFAAGGPSPIVEFTRAESGNPASGDPVHERTNEQGQATIGIEGAPQKREVGSRATHANKDAEVWALVQAKPPSMSQDLIDAATAAAGGISSAVTIPAEILLRSNMLKPAEYPFKVVDWVRVWIFKFDVSDPCSGTTAHAEGTLTEDEQGVGQVTGTIEVSGAGHAGKFGPVPVDVIGEYDEGKGLIYLTTMGGFGPAAGGGSPSQYGIPSNGIPVSFPAHCGKWTASADPGPPL